jgi:hypothetical protein
MLAASGARSENDFSYQSWQPEMSAQLSGETQRRDLGWQLREVRELPQLPEPPASVSRNVRHQFDPLTSIDRHDGPRISEETLRLTAR